MCGMLLADLVAAHTAVRATRSRKAKVEALADVVRRAGDEDDEVLAVAVLYLGGALRQRRTGLGWRGLADLPAPADVASVAVAEVDAILERLSTLAGSGSTTARRAAAAGLFARLTADEQAFLRAVMTGNVRQGALDSVMLDAVAAAADVPLGTAAAGAEASFSASGPCVPPGAGTASAAGDVPVSCLAPTADDGVGWGAAAGCAHPAESRPNPALSSRTAMRWGRRRGC